MDTLQDLLKQEIVEHKTTAQNLVIMTEGRDIYYDKYIETLQNTQMRYIERNY